MPALTGVAVTSATGTVKANVSIRLTGVSLSVGLGTLGVASTPQSMRLRLPAFRVSMAGISAQAGDLQLRLPAPRVSATGVVPSVGTFDLTFPPLQLSMQGPDRFALALPAFSLALTGATAEVGDLRLALPPLRVALASAVPSVGDLAIALPPAPFAFAGVTATSGRLALALRGAAMSLSGATGTAGVVALQLPPFRLGMTGYGPLSGSFALALPAMYLHMVGVPTRIGGSMALVMHTERQALTQYTNYPFNSFAAFNGVFLGASDAGVFTLSGSTDNGAPIQSAARVGITDFGTSHLKRVERVYIGMRASGRMLLRVITDERWTRDYAIAAPSDPGLHGAHVKLGRGLEARYWQFEIRNRDGSDFSLDIVEPKLIKLPRRVGGGDA